VQPFGDEVGRATAGEDAGGGDLPFGAGERDRAGSAGGELDPDRVDDAVVGEH
jgi:hypothetical protein